ncbi:hypothetical protein [Actinomyces slackii]|uniref:hypothetical protein n=1 Tax=Actinomyces slackii TaxID=52774 RepID=UPI000423635E|nr:hypothetical protein [Actinomyces slackii]
MSRSRLLILPALLALSLAACSGGGDETRASGSASASGSSATAASAASSRPVGTPDATTAPTQLTTPRASAVNTEAVESGDLGADQLDSVGTDEAVTVNNDVALQIGEIRSQDLAAGPGEIGGPGIVVPVTVSNTSGADLALSGLVITVSYGDEGTPAQEIVTSSDVIPASLAAGQSLAIERAFTVPAEGRGKVRIVVDMGAGYPAAVFEGAAPS